MRNLIDDISFALRTLAKHPTFAIIALLTLALGIGVTTAVTTIADATLLRAPEVEDPESLVALWTTCRRGFPKCSSSFLDFQDYRERSQSLDDIAGYAWRNVNLGLGSGAEASSRLALAQVTSGNYFELLGVQPSLGRLLQLGDDRGESGSVLVLGDPLWRELGADPEIVGSTVRLNGSSFTVVGVAPPGFRGLHIDGAPDLYVPLASNPSLGLAPERFEERRARWISQLVGRLAEGATVESARAEMLALSDHLAEEDPAARGPRTITLEAIRGHIDPPGSEDSLARFVLILMVVAGATLLIGSANLANLLLARAADRQRELATRLALGAGRARLMRQLLTESLVLAVAGGLLGLLVAQWTLHLFGSFELPGSVLVAGLDLQIDGRMLAIALVVSVSTGLLFGSVPAWRSARGDVLRGVAGARVGDGRQTLQLRHVLVMAQVALCFALLFGAGLFLLTVDQGQDFDLGFRSEDLALARFDLGLLHYSPERAMGFVRDLVDEVQALPGAERATVASLTPLGDEFRGSFVTVDGYEPGADEEMRVETLYVGADYFATLGIPRLAGPGFSPDLSVAHAPSVVINRAMAERYWEDRSAIGGVVRLGDERYEVVGVVDEVHWRGWVETPVPYVFFPLAQHVDRAAASTLTLAVRSEEAASSLLPALRQTFRGLDPELSLETLETMQTRVQGVLMPQRMGTLLLSILGGLMLLLTALGIYGVVGCTVAGRRREIGIRMALGAQNAGLVSHIVRGMAKAIAGGVVAGLVLSFLSAETLEHFLFGVEPHDPVLLLTLGVFLSSVALGATLLPAWSATRNPPIEALRDD